MKTGIVRGLLYLIILLALSARVYGQEGKKEKFDASTFILDHVADSHEWHILTKNNGESVAIYLPVILYSKEKGLDVFSSKRLAHGHVYKGYMLEEEGDLKGKIVNVDNAGAVMKGSGLSIFR